MSSEDNNRNPQSEEAGRLVGGFATGNLSESEQEALFQSALEDQEVFDQLMEEQALKELIEEPGVKAQILEAIAEKPSIWTRFQVWVRTPVAWGAAAAVTAALVVTVSVRKTTSTAPASELARIVEKQAPVETALRSQAKMPAGKVPNRELHVSREVVSAAAPAPASGPSNELERDQQPVVVNADQLRRQEPAKDERRDTALAAAAPPPPRVVAVTGTIPGESAIAKNAEVSAAPRQAAEERVQSPMSVEYSLQRLARGGSFEPVLSSQTPGRSDVLRLQLTASVPGQLTLLRRGPDGEQTPVASVETTLPGEVISLPSTGGFPVEASTSLILRYTRAGMLGRISEYRPSGRRKEAFSLSMQDRENRARSAAGKPALPAGASRAVAPSPDAQSLVVEIPLHNR